MFQIPENEQEWLQKEAEFHDIFPHCLGAIDGKHVVILAPHHSGTEFYNYKHAFSIVLMALVDKNYCFMFADVGCQGRISDGGVFRNSLLYEKLETNALNLPAPSVLPGSGEIAPYVFVADNAFPLSTNIMKPYPGEHREGSIKRRFNRNLSRARIVVENVFGIMSAIFRVLRKPIAVQPDRASNIVMSCVLLHNFLRNSKTSNNLYTPPGFTDTITNEEIVPGLWRNEQQHFDGALRPIRAVARRSALQPTQIRDVFAQHFGTL